MEHKKYILTVEEVVGEFDSNDFKQMLNQMSIDLVKLEGKKIFFKFEEYNQNYTEINKQ